jgi:hypothetical protein
MSGSETTRDHTLFPEGQADARQGGAEVQPSRFRPVYRKLSIEEYSLQDAIKSKAAEMERLFNTVKSGRYRSLAFTALEESVMWAVKEITS